MKQFIFFPTRLSSFFGMVFLLIASSSWANNITSVAALGTSSQGGFETPTLNNGQFQYWNPSTPNMFAATGYRFTSGTGLSSNNSGFTAQNPNAPQGNQIVFLQSNNAYVERTIVANYNSHYRFWIKAALRNRSGERKRIRVFVDNIKIGEFDITAANYVNKITLPIFLTTGNHTLRIQGINPKTGDHTAFIDDVRIQRIRNWHDGSTWQGGTVPGPNDHVIIRNNSVIGINGNVAVRSIRAEGQLLVAQNRNLNLSCKYVLVQGTAGVLQIGQQLTPYNYTATITLNATRNDLNSNDPTINLIGGMGTKFLGAMGGSRIELHGQPKTSWQRLRVNAPAGSTTIQLPVSNWKVGDAIVIAPSRNNWMEAEERTIAGIQNLAGGVKRLTLNTALSFPHTGVTKTYSNGSKTWTADLGAEVGMLTHNIKIQGHAGSESDNGFGAHTMIMMGSQAKVSNIELYRVGQKAILGRYPFHWHLLANGGNGQFLKNSSVHKSFNRAITIHGTHSTRVDRNVCYNHIGHGVFLEDGAEENNLIRSNFVLHTKKPIAGEELTPSEDPNRFSQVQNQSPASFWITNPKNTFQFNVAAGTPGTGFWFAFPTSPMGQSAGDSRFANIEPHKNPLTLFKNNCAHSCNNGFDVFDQLTTAHDLRTNQGWAHNGLHLIEDCLWYANNLALYTGIGIGGPSDNLIFRNNVFVENRAASMFASYSIIDGSVIVARSGENLVGAHRGLTAYRVYDGAGQVHNSHFIGWSQPNTRMFFSIGAAVKHPNHWFVGNTTDAGIPRMVLGNYDLPPAYDVGANDFEHPRKWSVVIRDVSGTISGKANTSIICNHPFVRVGNEATYPNWTNTYRSDYKFVLSRVTYPGLNRPQFPNVTVTRSGNNRPEAHVFYIGDGPNSYKEHHQLPFIANQNFTYTYAYETLPSPRQVRMYMDDAQAGDNYIAVFKNFAKLGGLTVQSSQGTLTRHYNYNSLISSNSSGYYTNNDHLYIKAVATSKVQNFNISWTSSNNYPSARPDTDGDYMPDGQELAEGRNPFHAKDLAAEFNAANNFEGWIVANIGNGNVSAGSLNGVANTANGDAQVINRNFNFDADEVVTIRVRMRASHNTGIHLFFGTNFAPGFSGTRRVGAYYNGNGAWRVLTFNVSAHADWRQIIKDIRIDPVTQINRSFNIDWIRADNAIPKSLNNNDKGGQTSTLLSNIPPTETDQNTLVLFPNPVEDVLNIKGIESSTLFQIIDINGRVVKTGQTNDNSINVQDLPKGNYWINLNAQTYPFIKK